MSNEETAVHAPTGAETQALASAPPAAEQSYAPLEDWAQEPGELPPRPRRRLLGVGGNPSQIALLGVLLLACGFIGGVLVEKGQSTPTTAGSAAGLASRLTALRGSGASTGGSGSGASTGGSGSGASTGGSGSGASTGGSASGGGFGGGGFARRFGGAGAGGATIGEVSYIAGGTLYVSGAEGDTVKVTTSAASSITKTVKSSVHGIHPGDTVIVRGTKNSSGAVSAESISVNAGASGGGVGALFGGGGAAGAGERGTGGGPALFGK